MRFLLSIVFVSVSQCVFSQYISPQYEAGKFRVDTLFQYYGVLTPGDNPGDRYAYLGIDRDLAAGYVTGVRLVVVIDSIQKRKGRTEDPSYLDGEGKSHYLFKNDTIDLPIDFNTDLGFPIGFRIIAIGTPTISGEKYYCEINLDVLAVIGWNLFLNASYNNTKDCEVVPVVSTKENIQSTLSLYPNPVSDYLQLNFQEASSSRKINVLDSKGVEVARVDNIQSQSYLMNTSELQSGFYMLVVKNKQAIESRNTFVVE